MNNPNEPAVGDDRAQLLPVIANDILQAYLADRQAGIAHDAAHYVAAFKGFEDVAEQAIRVIEFTDLEPPIECAATPSIAAVRPPAIRHIGRYDIIREIGRGGMGVVYSGVDVVLGRNIVAKTIADRGPMDLDGLARLQREAVLGSRLSAIPGVCPVLDIVSEKKSIYIIMPYIDGRTLEDILGERRRTRSMSQGLAEDVQLGCASAARDSASSKLPRDPTADDGKRDFTTAVRLIEKVARSLHLCHELGVVHRDLKPSNIMIGKDDEPTILDLGLAVDCDRSGALELSREGDAMGTLGYMAPEQVEGRLGEIDRRTDVFGLGVVLYETLTLEHPFPGRTRSARIKAVLDSQPTPPRRHVPSLPRDLEAVCLKAIEKRRECRYRTAAEFAEDLDAVIRRRPTLARPIGPIEMVVRFGTLNRREIILFTVIIVLLFKIYRLNRRMDAMEAGIKLLSETDTRLISVYAEAFSILIEDPKLKEQFLENPTSEESKRLIRATVDRSADGSLTVLEPRGRVTDVRPKFRIRLPQDSLLMGVPKLGIYRGDVRDFDLSLSRAARLDSETIEIELDEGTKLEVGADYEAVVYAADESGLYVEPQSDRVKFSIREVKERDEALARWTVRGNPFLDAYFQSFALADAGFFLDARAKLQSERRPTQGFFVPRIAALEARIRVGLGEEEQK